MPWWANLGWCAAFVLLPRRSGIALATVAMIPRMLAVASSVGVVWMLSGLAWFSVMAFYAMTALWPVLLWLLWRGRGARLAAWMIPLAVLESAGVLLGAPRFELRWASATVFAIGQVFFLIRTARTS